MSGGFVMREYIRWADASLISDKANIVFHSCSFCATFCCSPFPHPARSLARPERPRRCIFRSRKRTNWHTPGPVLSLWLKATCGRCRRRETRAAFIGSVSFVRAPPRGAADLGDQFGKSARDFIQYRPLCCRSSNWYYAPIYSICILQLKWKWGIVHVGADALTNSWWCEKREILRL